MGRNKNLANLYILLALLLIGLLPLGSVELASAHPANLTWTIVDTPDILTDDHDIVSPSEVNKLVVGSNGVTFYCVDISSVPSGIAYGSWSSGTTWYGLDSPGAGLRVWDIAVAPDDVDFIVAATDNTTGTQGPREVFISGNGGGKGSWEDTGFAAAVSLAAGEFISCVDISPMHGDSRDILVGTRDGAGGGGICMARINAFSATWRRAPGWNRDVYAAKFSPNYASDACIVVVASDSVAAPNDATAAYIGVNDLALPPPVINWATWGPVEVRDPAQAPGSSPGVTEIVTADLELPSDFLGQTPSLRRMYVSTDATVGSTGIFRIDDTTVYKLMDTTGLFATKRISSISYFGTYASGKLLAGEVYGNPCTATVPTWFTDSPTTCPIPCWYPALKPTTGAAGVACIGGVGYGNAQVAWSPTLAGQGIAYVGTSSACLGPYNLPDGLINCAVLAEWPDGYLNGVALDESAFGISRNNGETWNQLSLIDTKIDKLTDVAPSPDCSTVYLASSNNGTGCTGFDSVWRSSSSAAVASPLAAETVGNIWERVLARPTAATCTDTQSNYAILRLAPDLTDGQLVFWAAGGTGIETGTITIGGYTVGPNTTAVFWSPDYGDYWTTVTSRLAVQDMAAESKETLYILSLGGLVQKMPYTGTAWSSIETETDTALYVGHTIAARAVGNVLVGSNSASNLAGYPLAYSLDGAKSWSLILNTTTTTGNVHVAFDPAFDNNATIYAADDAAAGTVYRNTIPSSGEWNNLDMMATVNGAIGSNAPHPVGQFGVQLAFTGANGQTALYSAHRDEAADADLNSGVCRTLKPLDGMPKPGIVWDCLDLFAGAPANGVQFTLEPWSLKLCGCLTLDTDTTLWAIDNSDYNRDTSEGMLWANTDCLAKRGPALVTEDKTLIGCDPVSGRNQEVDLCWEQLCIATGYDIEMAKDPGFTIKVLDWASVSESNIPNFLHPADVLKPCCYIPAGGVSGTVASAIALAGNFECGHTYYWRVQVRSSAGNQVVRSPWSEVRSFTLKAGLPVRTEYSGLTLLSPGSGSRGCPVNKMTFSWSPFVNSTKYKFVLAKDAAMTQVVTEAEVAATAYAYEGTLTLEYGRNYFWRVMAMEPAPSDWSATFSFMTEAEPLPPAPPAPKPKAPFWIWPMIAIFVALFIAMIALVMTKPKYSRSGTISGGEPGSFLDKPKNPIGKVKDDIIMRIRRGRYLR